MSCLRLTINGIEVALLVVKSWLKLANTTVMPYSAHTCSLAKKKAIAQAARPMFVRMSKRRLLQRSANTPAKIPKTAIGMMNARMTPLVLVVDSVRSSTTIMSPYKIAFWAVCEIT